MLRLIDDQVGRLLNHLESTGKLKNTIVVYLTDHGDFFCDYGLIRKGVDLPEVLTRIPMVWSGWGIHAQTEHPAFVSTADIFPTLCEAIGAKMPVGTQGRSLWPLLQGKDYPREEFESIYSEVGFGGMDYGPGDEIEPRTGKTAGPSGAIITFDELNSCTQSGNMKMVRWGDWKLTFNRVGVGELFNVAKDPYELNNLYGDKQAAPVRERLMAELLRWTIRTQDDLPVAAYKPKWPTRNWEALYKSKG
jgi:arylsulfatase A-like enzyme